MYYDFAWKQNNIKYYYKMIRNKMELILLVFSCLISVTLEFRISKRGANEIYFKQGNNNFRISLDRNSTSDKNTLIEHEVLNKNQFILFILRQDWVDSLYNEKTFSTDWLTITIRFY